MTASRNLRNIAVFSVLFLTFAMPLFIQAQANDQALKYVPDNALFCIRINNINKSMTQLDQFLSDVYPISTSALVKALLPNLLGSPELAGLNMDGSITAFGTILNSQYAQSAEMTNIFAGILVPVTNYQEFINGIANKTPTDDNGVVKLTSLQNVLVTQLSNYALMTWEANYDNLVKFKNQTAATTLSSVLDSSEAKQATSEPVWIYGNIEQAAKTFGPMLTVAIDGLKSSIASVPSDLTGMDASELQNIMDIYVSMLDTILKEVKTVSISINPTQNALNITKVVNTVPGTKMAKMFATNSAATGNNLLPYLEDGSMMSFAFSLNSPILTESIDLQVNMLSMLGGDTISKDVIEKMTSISKQAMDCVSGNAVYTFSEDADSKFPFKGKYLIGVKDEKKFQQLINESSELMMNSGFMDIYKSMGMDAEFKINHNVETYKGVSIDSAKLSIKSNETHTPQSEMIKSMYGEGIEYRWGVTNGLFAAAIGSNSDKTMHELIDQIQSGSAKQICSETQAALALIQGSEKSDFFFTMNFIRLMKTGLGMTSSILPIKIPDVNVQTKSNLVIAGKSEKGKMTIQLAIPKEHIKEIMNTIITIQQQMMQPQTTAKL
ncbi:MAG: hypothetical protein JXA96_04200 [Sedimentisphaerales bacterium]|nr:hypothetical protein [Sedimentisphaerales bacterium]